MYPEPSQQTLFAGVAAVANILLNCPLEVLKRGVLWAVEKRHSSPIKHHSEVAGAVGKGDGKGELNDSSVVVSDTVGLFMIGRRFLDLGRPGSISTILGLSSNPAIAESK